MTEYSWDELRDSEGPFETSDSFDTQRLSLRSAAECSPRFPCQVCQGDCGTDDDCAGHLRCWQRGGLPPERPEINRGIAPGNGYASGIPGCKGEDIKKNMVYLEDGERDIQNDYCYDPYVNSATCKTDIPAEFIVSGELIGGQTCTLDKAVIVPACTELSLEGVTSPSGDIASVPAIISGAGKTNHFDVNGKLTLRYLILEHGLAFDYRGGSLHVSGKGTCFCDFDLRF